MKIAPLACAALIAIAGPVLAQDDPEPTVPEAVARHELMSGIGRNAKVLGDMAGEKAAFDAAAAEQARAAIAASAEQIPVVFKEPGADDPASDAKPEIWTGWEDFLTKASALKTAADGVDASSLDGVKAGMGVMGEACKACHTTYREK